MDTKYLEKVAQTKLFENIDMNDIPHVLDCLEYKIIHYRKNDYIIKVNEPFQGVYINLEGEFAVIRESYNGSRVVLNIFHAGDICGEAVAFCGASNWPATVQALSDCTLMIVHPENILKMCQRACTFHKVILANLVRVVSKKACDLNRKVEYLSIKSIKGKLSKYLLEQSDLTGSFTFKLPLNREMLADFLNISRPSMSRELGDMRDSGIIEFYKDSFRILDVGGLKALLED